MSITKLRITLKDREAVNEAIRLAIAQELENSKNLSQGGREVLSSILTKSTNKSLEKWFVDGEALTIDVYITPGICSVLENKKK